MTSWMTQSEAAEYLRCSPRQVRRLPLDRTFVGSSPRYAKADIDAYLERRKVAHRQTKRTAPRGAAPNIALRPAKDDDWLDDLKRRLCG